MLLKVSIGTNIQDGPWGGGNLFAVNLSRYLKNKGHEVIYDLDDRDIDIILLTEPRKTSPFLTKRCFSNSFNEVDSLSPGICDEYSPLVTVRSGGTSNSGKSLLFLYVVRLSGKTSSKLGRLSHPYINIMQFKRNKFLNSFIVLLYNTCLSHSFK